MTHISDMHRTFPIFRASQRKRIIDFFGGRIRFARLQKLFPELQRGDAELVLENKVHQPRQVHRDLANYLKNIASLKLMRVGDGDGC